jgi:hypothetical protein
VGDKDLTLEDFLVQIKTEAEAGAVQVECSCPIA